MDLSSKYRNVQVWLDNLYAGKPVPHFERNEQTIDLLHQLMEKNVARDSDTQLIVQDLKQKATEYTAEGQRLGCILASMNLKTGTLSQSGVTSLQTLTKLAWLLKVRDASDTSYLLALQALQEEADRIHEEFVAEERLLVKLSHKTKDALVKHNSIRKTCQDLEDVTTLQATKLEKRQKEVSFLQSKIQEYAKLLSKLKDSVSRTGVDSSVFHESLVKRAQDLLKLEDELGPLKKKLQAYNELPPDISQAKLKLVELRRHLEHLEDELSKKIGSLKL
ncbi:HAUS augmin-like complex subunit 1 [Littorina saxatilis]|uniref:HAUS augmin-like complex subunit 1 n=1 Tax=Littorina saxatilis TaxID=31220 RepID=A0AAN9AMX7_9CAEN